MPRREQSRVTILRSSPKEEVVNSSELAPENKQTNKQTVKSQEIHLEASEF
jgi:hypothetical protein